MCRVPHRSFTRALDWVECEWWTPVVLLKRLPFCGTFFNLLLSFPVQSSLLFDPFLFVFFFHLIPIIPRTSIDVYLLLFNPLPLFSSFVYLSTIAKVGILRPINPGRIFFFPSRIYRLFPSMSSHVFPCLPMKDMAR